MSAQIIAFPRKKPLEAHELPAHWGPRERSHYLHVTYDGFNSHEDAFHYCETMAAVRPQKPGESDMDYLLRRALAAVSTLKPLKAP